MEKRHRKRFLKQAIFNLVDHQKEIVSILPEIDQMNLRRMHLMSIFGMLLAASHVILFAYFTIADSESEVFWRLGILTTHSILLSIQALIFIITTFVRIRKIKLPRSGIHALISVAVVSVIAVGIALVSLDQLVTTAITPLLVICIFIAMLFTIRPMASVSLFLGTYVVYYFTIGLYQPDQAILLSNRVNGLTAVLMGMFLALVIWRNTTRDFLQKQFIAKQQKELEEKNNELALLAAVDGLTGLLNRRELDKSLSVVLKESNLNHTLSLILLDIDHFKAYNDLYGHVHGDECLRRVAGLLLKSVQSPEALVARFGGEEFVIILPGSPLQEAKELAENIRIAIVGLHIRNEGNPPLQLVSASFGVLTVKLPTTLNASQILNEVDTLMYAAKNQGRNLVVSA